MPGQANTVSVMIAPVIAASEPMSATMASKSSLLKATGADFSYLVRTAQRESNFDPTAKAPTSSATASAPPCST